MNKIIKIVLATCFFIGPFSSIFAIDLIWKDKYGARYYQCGGGSVGGQSRVKEIGLNKFRVKSSLINGEIRARSLYHAAQIGCGEAKEMEESPRSPSDSKE